eukprot:g6803.t1
MFILASACSLLALWHVQALELHQGHQAQHTTSLSRRSKQKRRFRGRSRQSLAVEIHPHGEQVTLPLEDMSSEYTGVIGVSGLERYIYIGLSKSRKTGCSLN